MIRSPIFPNISLCTTYLLLGVSGLFGEEVSSAKLSPLVSVAHPISNANISIIDDAFIANTQAQNLREIFNKNAEIQVGGSTQIAQKLYIRGFEDRMYRVRLNGITQSGNLFHHQGNLVLDSFLIKDIEIEKGLAKAEDGAGALAGGINITTKNAFDILQNRDYGAHFVLSGQSNKGVNTSLAAYGKFSKNLGLLAAYSFDNIPYYRDGNGDKVLSSKTQTQNASFTLTFLPAKNHSINVHYHFNHITSVAPYAANVITSTTPELFNNTLNAHNAALRYDYSANDSFMLSWNNYFSHKSLKLSPTDVNHSDITTTHDPEGAMDLSLMNLGSDLGFKHYFGASGHLFKYGLNYQLIATKAYDLDAHSLAHGNLG
ncbi:TonB-dependent siderophore receptor, partial [uncultured Helicobacter sp.]